MDTSTATLELLNRFDQLATQYAPDVITAAISAVRVSAISELMEGVFLLLLAAGIWAFLGRQHKRRLMEDREAQSNLTSSDEKAEATALFLVKVAQYSVPALLFLVSTTHLWNTWTWVTLFNPKLGLAHQLLGL